MDKGKPQIIAVAIQLEFVQMMVDQISSVFGDKVDVDYVLVSMLHSRRIDPEATVVAFSQGIMRMILQLHPQCRKTLICGRSLNILNLAEVMDIPAGKHVLLVNDTKENTEAMLEDLKDLDLNHHYHPFYPGKPVPAGIDYMITAGETDLIPKGFPSVINVGLRGLSLESILNLTQLLGFNYHMPKLTKLYLKSLYEISKRRQSFRKDRYISQWMGTNQDLSPVLSFKDFILESPAMNRMVAHGKLLAKRDEPIHVVGGLGCGKKRVAKALHSASPRNRETYLSINCASRESGILEKELFGWEESDIIYPGLLETSSTGTLCVEEVDALPVALQKRLLQVLTDKRLVRVNGKLFVNTDCRIITTTSKDLLSQSRDEGFLPELALLLLRNVCTVPYLNERMEDLEALIDDFFQGHLKRFDLKMHPTSLEVLRNHHWDGNVQELYNVLSHLASTCEGEIPPEQLPYHMTFEYTKKNRQSESLAPEEITFRIEQHGFLEESRTILEIYQEGRRANRSYGRGLVQKKLKDKGINLTTQQLRLRLERLAALGLLLVRKGRAGSTISENGVAFLDHLNREPMTESEQSGKGRG